MTDDFISDICKRHEHDKMITDNLHFPAHHWTHTKAGQQAHDDRAALLAEVERLVRERDEARAEVERLIASNKRLHHALFRIAGKAPFAYADDPWTIAAKAMKREAKP